MFSPASACANSNRGDNAVAASNTNIPIFFLAEILIDITSLWQQYLL
jgi:hypothetical protein